MNHVSKFRIEVRDIDRAERFYSALFQWTLKTHGEKYEAITAPTDNRGIPVIFGAINGEIATSNNGEGSTVIFVKVDSMSQTLSMVTAIGGKVLLPSIARSDGLYAKIEDPDGNIIGLFEENKVS